MDSDTTALRPFKSIMGWTAWAILGALVFWCWMVVGVAALAFFNYLVLFLDPPRPEDTPAWIAYSELAFLTLVWPLLLLLLTSWARKLNRALLYWIAAVGLLSLGLGGWNVAGKQFDGFLDRAICGLFILSGAALGRLGARLVTKK